MNRSLFLALSMAAALAVSGCESAPEKPAAKPAEAPKPAAAPAPAATPPPAAAPAAAPPPAPAPAAQALPPAGKELNLFAWSEYVPQSVIDGFTKETGIEVNYETYASNEEMLAKLVSGAQKYDLIQPSEYTIQ